MDSQSSSSHSSQKRAANPVPLTPGKRRKTNTQDASNGHDVFIKDESDLIIKRFEHPRYVFWTVEDLVLGGSRPLNLQRVYKPNSTPICRLHVLFSNVVSRKLLNLVLSVS